MSALTQTMIAGLATVRATRVYIDNSGAFKATGVTAQTLTALAKRGLIEINGASRATIKGRSVRRLVLTRTGKSTLSA